MLGRERGLFYNDVIWPYMRRYRNFEKRQAFREAVAVANTHNPVLADGSPAETGWEEINKNEVN